MPTPKNADRAALHNATLDAAGLHAGGGGGGVTAHSALTGLAADDHPQYATDADLTAHAATPHGGGGGSGTPLVAGAVLSNSGNLTYAGLTFADIAGMSITLTTGARRVLIGLSASGYAAVDSQYVALDFTIDGTRVFGGNYGRMFRTSQAYPMHLDMTFLSPVLTAGAHTFKVQWRNADGATMMTILADGTNYAAQFWVEEQADATGGGGGGGLLALNQYAPASQVSYSTTSATPADVDATNMAVTFVAPASGKVLVRLSAMADVGSASGFFTWGLREGATDIGFCGIQRGEVMNTRQYTATVYLTGLAAGSHTVKWSFAQYTPSGACRMFAGLANSVANWASPAIMEVWAAP